MRRRRRRRTEVESIDEGSSAEVNDLDLKDEESDVGDDHPQHWLSKALAILPVIICFLGNGRNPWVLGLAAVSVGLLMVVFPMRNRLPYVLLMVVAAVLLPGLISLVPIPLPYRPEWREALVNDLNVPLADTLSPQPWVTVENWAWMAVLMVWFCWGVSYWQTSKDRGPVVRTLALGLSFLACVSLVLRAIGWEPVSWQWAGHKDIGPFANRNHFACLMAMNAVLCLTTAYDLVRRRKRSWVIYGLGIVPSFAVILLVGSRGGFILFFCGMLAWFFSASVRRRSMQRLAIGGAALLALTTGAVLFGQQLLKRFSTSDASVIERFANEGRLEVYSEAFNLVLQHPALGVGLGNFSAVFGMTNQLHEGFVRYLHPESDWLWFLCEAGWPATLAGLIGVIVLLAWSGPWRQGTRSGQRRERRLRLAALLAVMLAVGHGVVDVPNHNLPMAMIVTLLAGMAFYHQRLMASPGAVLTRCSQLAGVLSIIGGLAWWGTGLGLCNVMGQTALERHLTRAKELSFQGNAAAAWPEVNAAISAAPLNWQAWFMRGEIGLKLGRSHSEAMTDFVRYRYLEPNTADNCMVEASIWLRYEPSLAIPAWREALTRERTLELNRYLEILKATEFMPELRDSVRSLATNARLLLAFLGTAPSGPEFDSTLRDLLLTYPTLEGLNDNDKYLLFYHWRAKGNRQDMVAALLAHEEWLPNGWRFVAEELGAAGKAKEAFLLAKRFVVPKVNLTADNIVPIEQLDREFKFNPSDASRGFRLYMAHRDANHLDESLTTLQTMSAQPTVPNDVFFEMAKVYALKEDFVRAWEMTRSYLQR
jgi:O-antigen ligase